MRAGWGDGEQVADGRWRRRASSVRPGGAGRPRRDRSAVLRPQERLAVLLGGRGLALVGEELALRARLDIDHGRERHAALELRGASRRRSPSWAARPVLDLGARVVELEQLRAGVEAAPRRRWAAPLPTRHAGATRSRLEAALRARTAGGSRPAAAAGPPGSRELHALASEQ